MNKQNISKSEFSHLIGLVYSCVTNPNAWYSFLEKTSQHLNAFGAHLVFIDFSDRENLLSYLYGFEEKILDKFDKYVFDDPALPYYLEYNGKPSSERRFMDYESYRQAPISKEFLQPLGVFERIGFVKQIDEKRHLALVFMIGGDRPPATDDELETISELQPHIERAFILQQEFLEAKFSNNILASALNDLPIGLLFLSSDSKILFSNSAAETIIDKDTSISISRGELRISDSTIDRRVRQAVRSVALGQGNENIGEDAIYHVEKANGDGDFLLVVSSVLSEYKNLESTIDDHPVAIVYLSDPNIQHETSEALLRRLFGLTNAEASTLNAIVRGRNTHEIASEAGLASETVRGYIKRILSKTNCRRQADLVRIVANSPAWIRHQAQVGVAELIQRK